MKFSSIVVRPIVLGSAIGQCNNLGPSSESVMFLPFQSGTIKTMLLQI